MLLLFDTLAYTKPKGSSDVEYNKHHFKSTLTAGCTIFEVKKLKTCIVFLNRAPTNNYGPGTFKSSNCGVKINMERSV